jgi:hypothetical protein
MIDFGGEESVASPEHSNRSQARAADEDQEGEPEERKVNHHPPPPTPGDTPHIFLPAGGLQIVSQKIFLDDEGEGMPKERRVNMVWDGGE